MTQRLAFLALALTLAAPAGAQGPAAFSRMGMGARAIAVGGQVADVSGAATPYLNAALAPFQVGQAVELSAGALTFDREWQAVQIGAPLRPRAGIAAGVVHGGVSNIDGRDASGFPTETYKTDEYAFFVAFGIRMSQRLSGGVGLRLYQSDVFDGVTPPTALGLQLGLAARLTDRLSLGLVADDLFARYQWNATAAGGGSATDPFPRRFTAGAAYALGTLPSGRSRGVLTAEVELATLAQETTRPGGTQVVGGGVSPDDVEIEATRASVQGRLGGELWLADLFAVRAGVDRLGAGSFSEARPAVGFALRQRFTDLDARVDYTAA
ncbi:MAG TPA: hypothetical protein VF576_04055, partial [Rubricoccaceae bacterium]